MPKYDYSCNACGVFEVSHAIGKEIDCCPECFGEIKRVYSSVGVSFKGSGFYSTDSRGK